MGNNPLQLDATVSTPPPLLDDAVPPSQDAGSDLESASISPAAHRGVALGFAIMGIATVGFSIWWAQKLAVNHVLSYHGCACGQLNRENMATFGLLPAVTLLTAHGARQAAILPALIVTGLCVIGSLGTYGVLWGIYFGLLYGHPT